MHRKSIPVVVSHPSFLPPSLSPRGGDSDSDEEDWDDGIPLQALRLIGRRNMDRGAIAELERSTPELVINVLHPECTLECTVSHDDDAP